MSDRDRDGATQRIEKDCDRVAGRHVGGGEDDLDGYVGNFGGLVSMVVHVGGEKGRSLLWIPAPAPNPQRSW